MILNKQDLINEIASAFSKPRNDGIPVMTEFRNDGIQGILEFLAPFVDDFT